MVDECSKSEFLGWLDRHGATVMRIARAYTRTAADAQDLAQEIAVQLWLSLRRFEARAGEFTWVYRVALNVALGWQRKESRRRARQQPLFDVAAAQDSAAQEAVERLYAAIRLLKPADAALVLLYLDDLSYRQMAEVLGITAGNVGVRLSRAKRALAELMREDGHGP